MKNLQSLSLEQLEDLISNIYVSCADYKMKSEAIKDVEIEIARRLKLRDDLVVHSVVRAEELS